MVNSITLMTNAEDLRNPEDMINTDHPNILLDSKNVIEKMRISVEVMLTEKIERETKDMVKINLNFAMHVKPLDIQLGIVEIKKQEMNMFVNIIYVRSVLESDINIKIVQRRIRMIVGEVVIRKTNIINMENMEKMEKIRKIDNIIKLEVIQQMNIIIHNLLTILILNVIHNLQMILISKQVIIHHQEMEKKLVISVPVIMKKNQN